MKHTYLHDVLPFLRELEREKQKQFEAYFRTAPLWLMDLFQSEIMEAGTTFIRENEIDKKVINAGKTLENGVISVGEKLEETFNKLF